VARDQQLLDTTRDYLHFITKFFEPINLSARHIYHSALELSPQTSIVQENYHCHPSQGLKPRVVCGLPSSWDQPVIIRGDHKSYTWSPCGQFFSVLGTTSIDVWDSLTLEKCSSLQLTEPNKGILDHSPNVLAYSPDGHSLATYDYSSKAINIWDTQTGGVIEKIGGRAINCSPSSVVWSLDGTIICTVYPGVSNIWDVYTHYIALGGSVSIHKLPSISKPFLLSRFSPKHSFYSKFEAPKHSFKS